MLKEYHKIFLFYKRDCKNVKKNLMGLVSGFGIVLKFRQLKS